MVKDLGYGVEHRNRMRSPVRSRASDEDLEELVHALWELDIQDKAAAGSLYWYGVRTRADLRALDGRDVERLREACGLKFGTAKLLLARLAELEAVSMARLVQAGVLPRGHPIDLPLPGQQEGCPALVQNAAEGSTDGVVVLLDARASVDVVDALGRTALFRAAGHGHYQIVLLLLEARANPAAKNQVGATPLFVAAQNGHPSVVSCLLGRRVRVDEAAEGSLNDSMEQRSMTALVAAAVHGHLAVVQLLLAAGARVDRRAPGGATALLVAAQNGHRRVVEVLLEKNASTEASLDNGATPLLMATQFGHGEAVRALLEHGAAVQAGMQNTVTPLVLAVAMGHLEIARMLLDAGADKRERTQFGTAEEQSKHSSAIEDEARRMAMVATLAAYP